MEKDNTPFNPFDIEALVARFDEVFSRGGAGSLKDAASTLFSAIHTTATGVATLASNIISSDNGQRATATVLSDTAPSAGGVEILQASMPDHFTPSTGLPTLGNNQSGPALT